jgi:uncharacterized protein (TIGR03083 family)
MALTVFRAEAEALALALGRLDPAAWERPTRCVPWTVRELVGHLVTAVGRVPAALAEPVPARADTDAVSYYSPDHRFSGATNADRVQVAQARASGADVATLLDDLAATTRAAVDACLGEPGSRVVRTRHGDAMALSEFLTTRVVELAVHGLDVADAVGREPWLTAPAAEHLQGLLFAGDVSGWDPAVLLRKATGRAPLTPQESARLGLRRLAFG